MFHICHHVLTRRSADFGDMFWPKSDVMAFSQAKILGSAGIVVKGTNIAVLGPPLNDYPHSINPAIRMLLRTWLNTITPPDPGRSALPNLRAWLTESR